MQFTKRSTLNLFLVGAAAVLAAALLFFGYHSAASTTALPKKELKPPQVETREPTEQEKQFGIQPEGVYLTSGGFFLDFRYRVLDVEKASTIINQEVSPTLTSIETGSSVHVPTTPKVGALRQTRMQPNRKDRMQFMLFANPGSKMKVGSHVTVKIGGFTSEPLIVQ